MRVIEGFHGGAEETTARGSMHALSIDIDIGMDGKMMIIQVVDALAEDVNGALPCPCDWITSVDKVASDIDGRTLLARVTWHGLVQHSLYVYVDREQYPMENVLHCIQTRSRWR